MKHSVYEILQKNLEDFVKKTGKTELLNLLNERGLLSLYELAKLKKYPYTWLDRNQREFLEKNGEKWLSELLGRKMPIFEQDGYGYIPVSQMVQEINKIMTSLGFDYRINLAHVDRLLRLKIKPESYRKFQYAVMLISILWGLKNGYFSFLSERDRKYLEVFSYLLLNRIINHLVDKRLKIEVSSDTLDTAISVLRDLGYDKDESSLVYKFYDLKALLRKLEKTNGSLKEDPDVQEFIRKLHIAFPFSVSKQVKEVFGFNLSYLYSVLEKNTLSYTVYDKFMEISKKLQKSENQDIKELGFLLEKILKKKKIKKRGFSKGYNLRLLEKKDYYSLGKKYVDFMKKKGDIKKKEITKEEVEAIGKLIDCFLDYLNAEDRDIKSVYKLIFFEE